MAMRMPQNMYILADPPYYQAKEQALCIHARTFGSRECHQLRDGLNMVMRSIAFSALFQDMLNGRFAIFV